MSILPAEEPLYQVPARFRFTENLHIVFWLIKDISWAMLWQPLGDGNDHPDSVFGRSHYDPDALFKKRVVS